MDNSDPPRTIVLNPTYVTDVYHQSNNGTPQGGGRGQDSNGISFGIGNGMSGGFGGSSRKRAKKRAKARAAAIAAERARVAAQAQAEAQEQARAVAEAHARANAQAQAEAQTKAHAQAQADAHARAHAEAQAAAAAEARARDERERVFAAHRQALETLPRARIAKREKLNQQHAANEEKISASLTPEIQSALSLQDLNDKQLLEAILKEKARLNYLIAQKSTQAENKTQSAHSFNGADPLNISDDQYKTILDARSNTAEQAYLIDSAWTQAYSDALDAKLLASAIAQLNEKSEALSKQYAEQMWDIQNNAQEHLSENDALSLKQAGEASRLWAVIAGPNAPTQGIPSARDKAKHIAEKLFTRTAARILARAMPQLALFYPTKLADGELGPLMLITPAAELGVSSEVDLQFIASRRGTIDVTHRMSFQGHGPRAESIWDIADGVAVSTQVPVRAFRYNPGTKAYEFTLDGETKPTLVWTPSVKPDNSTTYSPAVPPTIPSDPGNTLAPVSIDVTSYPALDEASFRDLILIFPSDSGLEPIYLVFNQREGDHKYQSKPENLPAYPNAVAAKSKTTIQGGGSRRYRWVNDDGKILEWDSRHGKIEMYTRNGKHMGEFDHITGSQTKPSDPTRRIEP